MENKITMAMPLREIPFIWDRERVLNILAQGGIYTVGDLVSHTEDELLKLGICELSLHYLKQYLESFYLHLKDEDEYKWTGGKNVQGLSPDLWERRRYEVAKDVLIKMLGTSNHCDMQRALNEEINKSIDIATTFVNKLKVISENEMLDGDWR